MLHIRDTAFKALGDANLADLKPEGRSPAFTIVKDELTAPEETEIGRVIEGTVTVPCFLQNAGCAVGAGFNRGADGHAAAEAGQHLRGVLPLRRAAHPAARRAGARCSTATACSAARSTRATPRRRSSRRSPPRRASPSAAPTGAGSRPPTAARTPPRPPPRSRTSRSSARSPTGSSRGCSTPCSSGARWSPPTGSARTRRSRARSSASGRLFYDGNSQGGIEGGGLTAVAPDFDRAVLGVPGMNYSTLLTRSVDFAPFRTPARGRLPRPAGALADLLAALEPVGPRRGERLRAAHDDPPAAEHAAARGAVPRRARRPPGGARHRGGGRAHGRRARVGPARPRAARPTAIRSTGSRRSTASRTPARRWSCSTRARSRPPTRRGRRWRRPRTSRRPPARTRTSSRAARRSRVT